MKVIQCDKVFIEDDALLDFFKTEELCNIPDNVMKQMAPYSVDWTRPDADKKIREADPSELTREDQIYLETFYNCNPYWRARMRALNLTRSLEPDYNEIVEKLNLVIEAADAVKNSKNFKNILGVC